MCHLASRYIATGAVLNDRSLSSEAGDESRMACDEPLHTRDDCWPEESIHRFVSPHSHLY